MRTESWTRLRVCDKYRDMPHLYSHYGVRSNIIQQFSTPPEGKDTVIIYICNCTETIQYKAGATTTRIRPTQVNENTPPDSKANRV